MVRNQLNKAVLLVDTDKPGDASIGSYDEDADP